MIILSILLILGLLLAAGLVVRFVFKPKWAWLDKLIIVAVVLVFICGLFSVCMGCAANDSILNLKAEAADIELYYITIQNCDNEYVRFDFYQRVQDYNELYNYYLDLCDSPWIGAYYPDDWTDEISQIEFALHGDTMDDYFEDDYVEGDFIPEDIVDDAEG